MRRPRPSTASKSVQVIPASGLARRHAICSSNFQGSQASSESRKAIIRARGRFESGVAGRSGPAVGASYVAHSTVRAVFRGHDLSGVISRPVIDDDHLDRGPGLAERTLDSGTHPGGTLIRGDDHRDDVSGARVHGNKLCRKGRVDYPVNRLVCSVRMDGSRDEPKSDGRRHGFGSRGDSELLEGRAQI